jgi:hypothetical protein
MKVDYLLTFKDNTAPTELFYNVHFKTASQMISSDNTTMLQAKPW